jgi:hypothetical protein
MVGGPDPEMPWREIQANKVYRGVIGGTDFRPLLGWVGEQQALGFYDADGLPDNQPEHTPTESYNYQFTSQHMSYMLWISDDAAKLAASLLQPVSDTMASASIETIRHLPSITSLLLVKVFALTLPL